MSAIQSALVVSLALLSLVASAPSLTQFAVMKQALGLAEQTIGRSIEHVDRRHTRASLAAAHEPSFVNRTASDGSRGGVAFFEAARSPRSGWKSVVSPPLGIVSLQVSLQTQLPS